ncbi:MAG TPA: response regulator transcription factor [Spirochaetota bacterium]|nr:response regulator transcription factor [Spirochaetota bacterium]
MNKSEIRIMLLDDHPAIRHGLALSINLEDDMVVSAECSNVEDAVRMLSRKRINLVLVDISLEGDTDGFDFIKAVKERYSSIKTLVLSMYDEAVYAEKAIVAGASGYMTKKEPIDRIITGIREVMNGNLYLPGDISGKLIMKLIKAGGDDSALSRDGLTPRELEILHLIGSGYTPLEIARKFNVSINTIETHRKHLKEKLGLTTCRELLKYAIEKSDIRSKPSPAV